MSEKNCVLQFKHTRSNEGSYFLLYSREEKLLIILNFQKGFFFLAPFQILHDIDHQETYFFVATTYRYFPFYQKLPFLLPFFGLSSVTYPLFSVGRERARGDYNCYCFAIKGAAPTLMSYSHERIQRVDIVHSLLESIIYPTKWYTVHIFGKSRFYYTPILKSKPDLAKVCVCFNLNIVFFVLISPGQFQFPVALWRPDHWDQTGSDPQR